MHQQKTATLRDKQGHQEVWNINVNVRENATGTILYYNRNVKLPHILAKKIIGWKPKCLLDWYYVLSIVLI